MIYEEDQVPERYSRSPELAFVFDSAKQYPNYPEPYILCQKWKWEVMDSYVWVKVPVVDQI